MPAIVYTHKDLLQMLGNDAVKKLGVDTTKADHRVEMAVQVRKFPMSAVKITINVYEVKQ